MPRIRAYMRACGQIFATVLVSSRALHLVPSRVATFASPSKDDPVNDMHPLGKLIQDAMDRNGWSLRELERRSDRAGHRMSHTNIGRIKDEPVISIKADVIRLLASILNASEATVVKAALDSMDIDHGMKPASVGLEQVVRHSSEISEYDQELLAALLGVMTERRTSDHEDEPVQPIRLHPVADADGEDAGEEQKIPEGYAAFERGLGDGIDPDSLPHDT